MEIITKINTVIEHCVHTKQHFYILLQDLSKAYDRVDLSLLKLALEHLSLSNQFVSITLDLFKHQSHSIIIDQYLSESFDLDQGIVQGELILPIYG